MKDVKESKLFLRVKHLFLTLPLLFTANHFVIFLTMLQSIKLNIHLVFSEITKLLRAIMAKFVKSKLLHVNHNGVKEPKSITELITINVNDHKN